MFLANIFSNAFDWVVEVVGSGLGPKPPVDHPPPTSPEQIAQAQPIPRKYQSIRDAVESKLEHLMRIEIPEHRDMAKNDVLELQHLEIEATTPEGETLLREYCLEFSLASRQEWVRDFVGTNTAIRLGSFTGVYPCGGLPSNAQIDHRLEILNQGNLASFKLYRYSKWVRDSVPPPETGCQVVLRIHDAQGQKPEIRRDTYPVSIGREGEVVVDGTYVSRHHCSLHGRGGQVELEDHSKHGTWLGGVKLHGQSKLLTPGKHMLKFGKAHGDVKDWPELELEIPFSSATPVANATPINMDIATTPIASEPRKLLAVLSVQDATGNPNIDVLTLPFSIGQQAGRDYVTPPTHAGVSREHLVIESITDEGAEVLNEAHAKNGTTLNGLLQGERFLWPFDGEITLAAKNTRYPLIRITLKHPQ